jgi:hypothetical protein
MVSPHPTLTRLSHTFVRIHRDPRITRLIRSRKCHKTRRRSTSAACYFQLVTSLFLIISLLVSQSMNEEGGSITYRIELRPRITIRAMQRDNLMPHKIISILKTLGNRVRHAPTIRHQCRSAPRIRRSGASIFLDLEPHGPVVHQSCLTFQTGMGGETDAVPGIHLSHPASGHLAMYVIVGPT